MQCDSSQMNQHPQRRNVITLMVGLKNGHILKNLTPPKMVNPRDIAGERRRRRNEPTKQFFCIENSLFLDVARLQSNELSI